MLLQGISHQSIVATDGKVSFAIFMYENPGAVAHFLPRHPVGFYAGDGRNMLVLRDRELRMKNVYRIDGRSKT